MESLERSIYHAAQCMLKRAQRQTTRPNLHHINTSRIRHFHVIRALQANSNTPSKSTSSNEGSGRDLLAKIVDETSGMRPTNTENKSSLRANMDILTGRGERNSEDSDPNALRDLLSFLGKDGQRKTRPNIRVEPLKLKPAPMRLKPSLGRTVHINTAKGRDVAGSLRMLQVLCSRNNVKLDFNKQRFHERPGLKRKRLVSERWQKRFKQGFQAMVARATQIRKMGY